MPIRIGITVVFHYKYDPYMRLKVLTLFGLS